MLETSLQKYRECIRRLRCRVCQSLHKGTLHSLDLRVLEDLSESLQAGIGGGFNLGMRIINNAGKMRNDGR